MMCMDAYVTPTNHTDCSRYIKAIELIHFVQSYGVKSHHIMPLVINSLAGGHTHTHTHTHTQAHTHTDIRRQKQC